MTRVYFADTFIGKGQTHERATEYLCLAMRRAGFESSHLCAARRTSAFLSEPALRMPHRPDVLREKPVFCQPLVAGANDTYNTRRIRC